MASTDTNLSGPQSLAGPSVLGTIAIPGAQAATKAATSQSSRSAWDKAMADLERAKAASDAFDAPFLRIEDTFKAEADKVPHVTVEGGGYGRLMTTADRDVVMYARKSCSSLRNVEACAYADAKARQQLVDVADARDATIAAIDKLLGRSAANNRYDTLTDAIVDAEELLLNMPAPNGDALLWKVNRLYTPGEGIWEAGYEAQTHADLHRFLSQGGA